MGRCSGANPCCRFCPQIRKCICLQVWMFISPKISSFIWYSQTFLAQLDKKAEACNYTGYVQKHVTFPPKGTFPLPGNSTEANRGCDLWDEIFVAALAVNPAFNIYRIFDTYPILWDVLGFPSVSASVAWLSFTNLVLYSGSFPQTQLAPLYFDREDVKKAIHAPAGVNWTECSNDDVFPKGDASLPPALSVLPSVIEKNNRTVIVHGLADFILIAEGYAFLWSDSQQSYSSNLP